MVDLTFVPSGRPPVIPHSFHRKRAEAVYLYSTLFSPFKGTLLATATPAPPSKET